MASSLFQKSNATGNNNIMNTLTMIKSMGNPQLLFQNLMSQNPQFKQFVQQNQNKSVDEIAQENGIDLSQIRSMFKR